MTMIEVQDGRILAELAAKYLHGIARRTSNRTCRLGWVVLVPLLALVPANEGIGASDTARRHRVVAGGLDWLSHTQSRLGHWSANDSHYPTAMTALAGMAICCEGSTATQGRYADNIRRAVDYLISRSRSNGLIGDPARDDRYTYGHGFSMLFLSQVLGEEEDETRRKELIEVLTRAVRFTGRAQTKAGGWGYVSARDGHGFDEGSTTITQVQGLRSCRNAGIPVPREIIDKAVGYIRKCTLANGGVQYSSKGGGGRPAITAAAVACLFNAGQYDSQYVPRLLKYCDTHLGNISHQGFGHWHYAHYYYAQVRYREGGAIWRNYYDQIAAKLLREATETNVSDRPMVYWDQGYIGPVYTTAINLTILQLEKATLPIYQR